MATQGFFPATEPVASPVGLLNSDGVEVIKHPPSDDGWLNGPQDVEILAGAFDLILSDYCSGSPDALVQENTGICKTTTYPFGIIASYPLLRLGGGLSADEIKTRVMHAAETLTQKGVEHELWTGDLAMSADHFDASYLAMHGSVNVSPGGAAVALDHALSSLEWALGQCSAGTGVIHMTRDAASRLTYFLVNDGDKLRTVLGTPVVVGSGYTGVGPAGSVPNATVPFPAIPAIGHAPTTTWMYATGPVVVHLGSVQFIGERRDAATNEITVMAGRPAAVYWDSSCHFAAEANLTTAIG
jgi:hypothetical protein